MLNLYNANNGTVHDRNGNTFVYISETLGK